VKGPNTSGRAIASHELILGVDPGVTGAFALYDPISQKLIATYGMPCFREVKGKSSQYQRVDAEAVGELLHTIRDHVLFAVIEKVGAMPDQGVVSMFNFGMYTGILHGAMAAAGIKYHEVEPQIWKLLTGTTRDKKSSMRRATDLFPEFAKVWSHNWAHGHAEAALIALYGVRIMAQMAKKQRREPSEFRKAFAG
jgi:crossover junction endodeoxyribonuclease RuvC